MAKYSVCSMGIVSILLLSGMALGLSGSVSADAVSYTLRAPISFTGNAGFTSQNGVTDGSGTAEDPYIIEGWEFHGFYVAIWIYHTDAHFVIRDILASDGLGGVYLYDVENAIVKNVNISHCDHAAVYLPGCRNVQVTDSYLAYCGHEGVAIDATWGSSSDITLSRNVIVGNEWTGINCDNTMRLTVTDNAGLKFSA